MVVTDEFITVMCGLSYCIASKLCNNFAILMTVILEIVNINITALEMTSELANVLIKFIILACCSVAEASLLCKMFGYHYSATLPI